MLQKCKKSDDIKKWGWGERLKWQGKICDVIYEQDLSYGKLASNVCCCYRIIKFSLLGIDFSASHMKT